MLVRALLLRCPNCGGPRVFATWFRMKDVCPTCGHRFLEEEGFFIGGYAVNFFVLEGLVLICLIPYSILVASDPERAVLPFVIAALVVAVVAPVIFFPFSRTLWVAIVMIARNVARPKR